MRLSVSILAVLGLIAFFSLAKPLLIPIVLSFFLFFLLDPLADKAEKLNIPRILSTPILIFLSFGILSGAGWVAFVTSKQLTSQIPAYSQKLHKIIFFAQQRANEVAQHTANILPHTQAKELIQKVEIVQGYSEWSGLLIRGLDSFMGVVGTSLLVLLLTSLLLIEKNQNRKRVIAFLAFDDQGTHTSTAEKEIYGAVQSFFIGNLVAGICSSIIFCLIFLILGLDNKIPLGIGAGFLNLIPIFGPLLSVVLPFAQALLQFNSTGPFVGIMATSLIIHFIVGNLVLPKIIGKSLDLNIVAATIGLLFWGWLWGLVGIFLAVPLTAILKIMLGARKETRSVSVIFSESVKKRSPIVLLSGWRFPTSPSLNK